MGLALLALVAGLIALGFVSLAKGWRSTQVSAGVVVAAAGMLAILNGGGVIFGTALAVVGAILVLLAFVRATEDRDARYRAAINEGRRAAEQVRSGSSVDRFIDG